MAAGLHNRVPMVLRLAGPDDRQRSLIQAGAFNPPAESSISLPVRPAVSLLNRQRLVGLRVITGGMDDILSASLRREGTADELPFRMPVHRQQTIPGYTASAVQTAAMEHRLPPRPPKQETLPTAAQTVSSTVTPEPPSKTVSIAPSEIDMDRIVKRVYRELEKKLRFEHQKRGR
ncbi:hypothetical protein J2T17_002625 [Paenibacillus mucilaginosus]|uniref:hypothetical protein n=1 Tax=Paenibacillus mucilaginosus TaxID=61624 RepID=UPI003D1E5221